MIAWTFYFQDGNVRVCPTPEDHDELLSEMVYSGFDDFLRLPNDGKDVFISMSHVRLITREIVEETYVYPKNSEEVSVKAVVMD